jgi:hypothetical protein
MGNNANYGESSAVNIALLEDQVEKELDDIS